MSYCVISDSKSSDRWSLWSWSDYVSTTLPKFITERQEENPQPHILFLKLCNIYIRSEVVKMY